jgi:hypothetical protein
MARANLKQPQPPPHRTSLTDKHIWERQRDHNPPALSARDEADADALTFNLKLSLCLPRTLPFYLHILVETPAALHFFLHPTSQLLVSSDSLSSVSDPSTVTPSTGSVLDPTAAIIIQQYATLLFVSNLIALIFALSSTTTTTSRQVAAALALYHVAPLYRATARLLLNSTRYYYPSTTTDIRTSQANGIEIAQSPASVLGGPWVHAAAHAICCAALLWFALTRTDGSLWRWKGVGRDKADSDNAKSD